MRSKFMSTVLASGTAMVSFVALITAVSAPAEAIEFCPGEKVRRCVGLTKADGNYRAHGSIYDFAGVYQVSVNQIRLQRYSGSSWVTLVEGPDMDGWWSTEDIGQSPLYSCAWSHSFRPQAYFQWKDSGTGVVTGEWITGGKDVPC